MSDSPTLYTVPQAAGVLGCSESAVRKWLRERRLPVVKLGTAVRLRREDVERVAREGSPALAQARRPQTIPG
jgi:excisionase family DNA binding protein